MRHAIGSLCVILIALGTSAAQSVRRSTPATPPFEEHSLFKSGDTFELILGAVPIEGDSAAFSKAYTVRTEGSVDLPYIGLVRAAGLNANQLEKAIELRLMDEKIFRSPTITINIPEQTAHVQQLHWLMPGRIQTPRWFGNAGGGARTSRRFRPGGMGIALREPVILPDEPMPPALEKLFKSPADFAHQPGDYRSPLLFEDGEDVRTKGDWESRRAEIRERWHAIMGPWPALVMSPRCEIVEETERDGFIQRRVRLQIAQDQHADAYLLLPKGKGPFAAVLVPFYEPETSIGLAKPHRDFAYQLTKRGFVTLSIGSPGGDARKPGIGEAICQPLSFLAYVSANCANFLGSLPEVDPKRIGTVGHSYGGKWAMFAASLYDRFACGAWSDPGIVFDETRPNVNYWEPWYLGAQNGAQRKPGLPTAENPRTGAYAKMIEQKIDLHELHALMAPRPFFVSGGSEDPPSRWRALNHSVAVNRLLGFEHRVGMSNRPDHEPNAQSNEQIYQFFQHFLQRKDDRE